MQLAPSALHATGEDLAARLGWQLDGLDYDGIVHLQGSLERQIGMRLINNGSTVQLWATGGTHPADHPADAVAPLPYRHSYNMAVHIGALTEDEDPGVVLYDTVRDNLLPVFDAKPYYVGHRPWEPDIAPAVEPDAEVASTPAAGADEQPAPAPEPKTPADQPEPQPEPEAKPAPKRTRRAKTDPATEPQPRPTRKRTTAKPAAPAPAEPKPRVSRKRTTAKPKPATS